MRKNEFRTEPVSCSVKPLSSCQELCISCNQYASVCQVDIVISSPGKGKYPIAMHPGECYYYGSCVMACPVEGAIRLRHPLANQTKFV